MRTQEREKEKGRENMVKVHGILVTSNGKRSRRRLSLGREVSYNRKCKTRRHRKKGDNAGQCEN